MRDDRERLQDIHEAIERIEKYAVQGYEAFSQDELVQTWILYHLQIVGEASRGLSTAFRAQYSIINWAQPIGMRNVLIHHYFGLDPEVVWAVVEHDLPHLKEQIELILQTPQE